MSVAPQLTLPVSGLLPSGWLASNPGLASVTEVPPSDVPVPVPVPVPVAPPSVEFENKSDGLEPLQATRSTATKSEEAKRMRMTS